MALHLELDGIEINMTIREYKEVLGREWCDAWCKVDYSIKAVTEPNGKQYINIEHNNTEILLACEVKSLRNRLNKLLNDELEKVTLTEMIEPDFQFELFPKKNGADITATWIVNFWYCGGLTANSLNVTLGREDIIKLRDYLDEVIGG